MRTSDKNQRGATLVEYVLLLACIVFACVLGIVLTQKAISNAFTSATSAFDGHGSPLGGPFHGGTTTITIPPSGFPADDALGFHLAQ